MEHRRNVLVLMEDALRYDGWTHSKMDGVRKAMTPYIDYQWWYTVNNCSDPSIATMITGKYPWEHGVRYMGDQLIGPTIFDTFRQMGYTTIYAGWYRRWMTDVTHYWGYYTPGYISENRGQTSERAKDLIERANEPWFCFIRHMWCHAAYVGDNYWESVRATGEDLEDLIAWVLDRFPDTTIIMTADHGEMLPSDKENIEERKLPPQHAWGLWEPQIHVPMVVHCPDMQRNWLDLNTYQHTSLVDVMLGRSPTLMHSMRFEGTGVDKKFYQHYHRAVIHGEWKLIVDDSGGITLYPWGNERVNVAEMHPEIVAAMMPELPPAVDYNPTERRLIEKRLEELGYADAT